MVHALCEVIERDAAAVWQAQPPDYRQDCVLDLASVTNEDCRSLLAKFAAADIAVVVHEVTSDIGVPVFLCQIHDGSALRPLSHSGMGAHLNPDIALSRALTEAAQSRLTYITGSRDDIFRNEYRAARRSDPARRCKAPPRAGRPMPAMDPQAAASETFERDIEIIIAMLARAGLGEVVACDLSVPGIGIPVVRVVVPGLEAPDDDPSYRPGARARRRGPPAGLRAS
jgi:ribosomal protein S12 methylthiotransferase accessory factor